MNICNCHWKLSQLILSNNTKYKTFHTKYLCIWKSKNSCMDCPKQGKLPMINWSYIWTNLDMIQHSSLFACGGTKHSPFNFHWWWITLGQIWASRWYHPSPRRTKNNLQDIWGLVWQAIQCNKLILGLIRTWSFWSQFKTMWPNHCTNFITPPQGGTNMHLINGCSQIMVIANPLDTSTPIREEHKYRIQQILGTFLYYPWYLYCTIIPALNSIADQQAHPT